jgi:hypothetical protein
VVLYGMLKNRTPYDERRHREQLGLLSASDHTMSTPVDIALELVDLVDSHTDLTEDPPGNDDLQVVP